MTETERVARGLIERTLPKSEWTHEARTVTRFYVMIIDRFLPEEDRAADLDQLASRLIAALGDRRLPLRHYSEQRLFSVIARHSWVEPDLLPI